MVTLRLLVNEISTASTFVYRRRESGRDVGVPRLGDLVSTGVLVLPDAAQPVAGLLASVTQVLWSDDLTAVTVTVEATTPSWSGLAPGLHRDWRPSPA